MERRRFLSVPMNLQSMYDAEHGIWNEQEHHIWNLTEKTCDALWKCGVFDLLNRKFNLIIDDFEDEHILYQKLYFVKDELFEELDIFDCKCEIQYLKSMINFAIEHRTLLSIFL